MICYLKVDGTPYQFERPETDSRDFHIGPWAKFCPLCLDGWAHMSCVKSGRFDNNHRVAGQLCYECGQIAVHRSLHVPGSLLEEPATNFQTLDWDLLDYLPRELLLREFRIHDRFFTRQDTANAHSTKHAVPSTVDPRSQPGWHSGTSHERTI